LAVGLLPAAATTIALASGTGTAGANTTTQQHTFTDGASVQHTCTISLTRTIPFNGDSQVGEGGTLIEGDAACLDGTAFISASYNDPDGHAASSEENTNGSATFRRYGPIGSSFTTIHRVDFGCLSDDCEFNATRSK
jgi:hypothetical protein